MELLDEGLSCKFLFDLNFIVCSLFVNSIKKLDIFIFFTNDMPGSKEFEIPFLLFSKGFNQLK